MQTCSGTGRRLARVECGVVSIGCVRSAGLPCPLQRARPHGCRRRRSHVPKAAAREVHASLQLWAALNNLVKPALGYCLLYLHACACAAKQERLPGFQGWQWVYWLSLMFLHAAVTALWNMSEQAALALRLETPVRPCARQRPCPCQSCSDQWPWRSHRSGRCSSTSRAATAPAAPLRRSCRAC